MPTITIEYLPGALIDLEEILDYVANENREAALQVLEEFDISISKLEKTPLLGTIPRYHQLEKLGYRILTVRDFQVFYRITNNIVEIHHIIHGWKKFVPKISKERCLSHKKIIERLKNNIKKP